MFELLLLVISYGAMLLLLMPPTGAGVISAAVMFALGVGLMICKKSHRICFWKSKQYYLIPSAALIVMCMAPFFYIRWLPSSKMQAIASIFHMTIEAMLIVGAILLAVLSIYFVYSALQMIASQSAFKRNVICSIIASVVTVILAQIMINVPILSMGCLNFMWGVLIVASVILLLYCLLGKGLLAVSIGTGIFMVISTINVYVYSFRRRLFEPVDVFSAGTAMNVAENYSLFPIPQKLLVGWAIFSIMIIALFCLQYRDKAGLTGKKRVVLLAGCAISFFAVSFYTSNLKTYHWQKEGANFNGYVLDFAAKFKEISATKPDDYSADQIAKLAEQYAAGSNPQQTESSKHRHIIAIMNEAFSDLSVVGEFETNMEVMPFISSLKENTISGYALASVYGGNTANSEYEFLTGNSLAWLSPNAVPYQQYVRSTTYSMVSYLKSFYNYKCVAMHPFQSSGCNRPAAYGHLGFDECYFVEDFPQMNYVREYISDQEMFEFLIKTYEEQKEDPLFLFGVTMQNHGGYTYAGENYTKHISLNDYDNKFPEVEQYLSLIHETDKAVEYLITYFQNVDEEVVIVFFGDHQPKIDELFYDTIGGITVDNLSEQQKRYKVPFFVWANYDIEEEYIECTSLNYLSSYVYNVAGIALPPYNQFLQEMEGKIPSINANGFYSVKDECYLSFEEADEEELFWLKLYEALQYNNIFDKEDKSRIFFPVLE